MSLRDQHTTDGRTAFGAVYRSDHPDVIAAWADSQAAYEAQREARAEALVRWGFAANQSVYVVNTALSGHRWAGIAWTSDEDPPAGWRRDKDDREFLVPHRRSALGKRVDAEFAALARTVEPRRALSPLGMPAIAMGAGTVSTYAARLTDGVVWVGWASPPVEGPDPTWWDWAPLSEYYALVEAGNDPLKGTSE